MRPAGTANFVFYISFVIIPRTHGYNDGKVRLQYIAHLDHEECLLSKSVGLVFIIQHLIFPSWAAVSPPTARSQATSTIPGYSKHKRRG